MPAPVFFKKALDTAEGTGYIPGACAVVTGDEPVAAAHCLKSF